MGMSAAERIDPRDERNLVLQAVGRDPNLYRYASEELRKDRAWVLDVIRQDWRALEHTSELLKGDREIVLSAVKQDGRAMAFASREMRNDKEIVLAVMQAHPEDAYVQAASCRSIASLATHRPDLQTWFGEKGACEAVVACVRTHHADRNVALQGCRALGALCTTLGEVDHLPRPHEPNQDAAGTAGVCAAVVGAVFEFWNSPDVLGVASVAGKAVCLGHYPNQGDLQDAAAAATGQGGTLAVASHQQDDDDDDDDEDDASSFGGAISAATAAVVTTSAAAAAKTAAGAKTTGSGTGAGSSGGGSGAGSSGGASGGVGGALSAKDVKARNSAVGLTVQEVMRACSRSTGRGGRTGGAVLREESPLSPTKFQLSLIKSRSQVFEPASSFRGTSDDTVLDQMRGDGGSVKDMRRLLLKKMDRSMGLIQSTNDELEIKLASKRRLDRPPQGKPSGLAIAPVAFFVTST